MWPSAWRAYAEDCLRTVPNDAPALSVHYEGELTGQRESVEVHWRISGYSFVGPSVAAEFDAEARRLTARVPGRTQRLGFNNALRIWTSITLPTERDGLMIHAASCILENRGVVIAGVSGAGKSTFANGLQEATYLTDDITLVDRLSTEPRLLATPFHGSLGRVGADEEADLSVVGILSQSPAETRIRRLRPAEAAAALLRHVVAFSSDKRLTGPILERVASLVANVPVFDIARSLEDSSDEVCRKLLAAAEADA